MTTIKEQTKNKSDYNKEKHNFFSSTNRLGPSNFYIILLQSTESLLHMNFFF